VVPAQSLRNAQEDAPSAQGRRLGYYWLHPHRQATPTKHGIALDVVSESHATPEGVGVNESVGFYSIPERWDESLEAGRCFADIVQRHEERDRRLKRVAIEPAETNEEATDTAPLRRLKECPRDHT
jgi:hypothetical protein